jgi:hypothetical protein
VPFLTTVLILLSLYDASKWIDAARPRSIRINGAAGFTHKGTTQIFLLRHLEGYNGQTRPWADVVGCVAIQELSGGAFQVSLQTNNVVGGQELIQVTATPVKTFDARATGKLEGVIYCKLLEIFHLGRKTMRVCHASCSGKTFKQ